jgi:hypothetical protein
MLNPADQTAKFVPVETGLEDRTRVEILSPEFKPNDLIVTVGNHMLENGKKVEVSQLSRLHMAESLAAAAANKSAQEKQAAEAAAKDKQPEQQPAAETQPQTVPAESGEKAQ